MKSLSAQRGFVSTSLVAVGASLFFSACSGGGGSSTSTIQALSVADQMSVLTVPEVASLTGGIAPGASVDPSTFPDDSDYHTDEAHFRVYDPSMDTLGTVNHILCMLTQTAYAQLINVGAYKAQIDIAACNVGGEDESGQASGSDQELEVWTVRSARPANGADQTLHFWIAQPEDGDEPAGTLYAEMTISEGASADNPFGDFELNFMMIPEGEVDATFSGCLSTTDVEAGRIGFTFYEAEGDVTQVQPLNGYAHLVQANVTMSADQSEGVAYIVRQERSNHGGIDSGLEQVEYAIAFDASHVLRSKNGDPGTCLSRVEYDTKVWRYELYHASGENAGSRVERDSGFGFRTEEGAYGWIGYHGLWVSPGVELESGDTLVRDQYGSEEALEYTLLQAPGKLVQNTRNELTLTELAGESFEWWDFGEPGQGQQWQPTQRRVAYDAPNWICTATFDQQSGSWEELHVPSVIDVAAYHFLSMWSQSLGGSVSYTHGSDYVTYYSQVVVNGAHELLNGHDTVDLYGYVSCLRGELTTADAASGDVYLPDTFDVEEPHHYRFHRDDLTLYLVDGQDEIAVGLLPGEGIESGPFMHGLRTGALVVSTSGITATQDVFNANVFYTYETGPNAWNQLATLVDAQGDQVTFDPPIQFSYMHATDADRNGDSTYDGRTYLLSYEGSGNLTGIPHEGIDLDGDDHPDRWYALFSIADATLMGPNGDEYALRALDGERTLIEAPGECGSLDLDDVDQMQLPTASNGQAPTIGPIPEVTAPPRVIYGVPQGT